MRRKANERSNEEDSYENYDVSQLKLNINNNSNQLMQKVLEAHAEEFLDAPEYQFSTDEFYDTNQSTIPPIRTDKQDSKNIEYKFYLLFFIFYFYE